MNATAWKEYIQRFPQVPAGFRIETTSEPTPSGKAIEANRRPVIALAFSKDGREIAASGGGMIPGAVDIRVFDVQSRELRTICHYHPMGVFDLAFDARTGLLASASHDYSVVLWNLEQEDAIFLVGGQDAGISRHAVAHVGTQVVVADGMTFAGQHASLAAIDLETGERRTLLQLEGDLGVAHLGVLPRDNLLVVAINEMRSPGKPEIRIVDLEGTERARFQAQSWMYDLAAVDSATLLATGSMEYADKTEVFALDAVTGAIRQKRTLGRQIGSSLAMAPSRDRVAMSYHRGVDLCAVDTLEPILHLDLGYETACAVAWSPDGAWIAVGTVDKTLRLFDAVTGREHLG